MKSSDHLTKLQREYEQLDHFDEKALGAFQVFSKNLADFFFFFFNRSFRAFLEKILSLLIQKISNKFSQRQLARSSMLKK